MNHNYLVLTATEIKRHFGIFYFERGMDYCKRGHVMDVSFNALGNREFDLSATVSGNQPQPYYVDINLKQGKSGVWAIMSECSCPIEDAADDERRQLLIRRIAPLMLRRKKQDVVKELPEKVAVLRTLTLDGKQRELYETVRIATQEKVKNEIEKKGLNRSQIVILDALLKLRQVCCDPQLVKLASAKAVKQSAKMEFLFALLPELIAEGRRILLFSQFTEMLDLIENRVQANNITYVRLDGKTKNREAPVQRFQNNEVPLLLIRLKAGDVGLNLTAADTVIHYDPWWNPAAENQATDRAHRIGQNKTVFVYKLICEGTVEEKIHSLQQRKQALADGIYADKNSGQTTFSGDDLNFLLQALPD